MLADLITLFLCGDVMTGRGIDQALPYPVDPRIYEPYVKNARGYLELAERENGPVPDPVDLTYIWGDVLPEFDKRQPDAKIINLETSITTSDDYWKGKGINYRMSPKNARTLSVAGIDLCALANNHVLDWGVNGLQETLRTMDKLGIKYTGAGKNESEAKKPASLNFNGNKITVLAVGMTSSGIPSSWQAQENRAGIFLLPSRIGKAVKAVKEHVGQFKNENNIIIISVHWGKNWGYDVLDPDVQLAHRLIDEAGVDIVHGHSSHHVKGIEVYRSKLILYGCGDFLNDYEGITGKEEFRDDLTLMYFPEIDPETGRLIKLTMTPMQIKNLRLNYATEQDAKWLERTLSREGEKFGTDVRMRKDNRLVLEWE